MLIEIVTPYFCFYTGGVLISQVKQTVEQDPKLNDKGAILSEFCEAMDDQVFAARKNFINRTVHGTPCIEAYEAAYTNPAAAKFDPVSLTLSPREMCGEFVKEINELLEEDKANMSNAVRYSYLISQQVDIQMNLIDNYSSCTPKEAAAKPRETCINIMLQPTFDLFSSAEKAEVCQIAVGSYNALKNQAAANGGAQPDACATLNSHLF